MKTLLLLFFSFFFILLFAGQYMAFSPGFEYETEVLFNNVPVFIFDYQQNTYLRIYEVIGEIPIDKVYVNSLLPIYEEDVSEKFFTVLSNSFDFEHNKIYAWCIVKKDINNNVEQISNILYFKISNSEKNEQDYKLYDMLYNILKDNPVFQQLLLEGFYPTGNIKINGISINNKEFYKFIYNKKIKSVYIK